MAMVVSSTHDHDLIHEKEDQISNLENFCRHEDDDHGGVNHNHNDDDDRDRGYEHNHPIWRSNSISSCCSQLDIPLDNLEDIEFFPNFGDDFMSLPRGHLEITSSFTPTTPAAAAVYYQSLSPSVGDAIHDYRDWYKFYSVDSTTNDQNRSIDQTAASLDRQNYKIFDEVINCDNQSMIMYDRNHTVDQSAAIDHQNNIFVHELSDNQSVMISTYDDQNRKSQYVEGYDNSTAAMLYGQDESGGFQKTKMRSKRARPRRPPPRSSTAGGSKRKCCTHCETELTPQWRMGPMGPNSLCNACGVRYQTRRLLPEYRPAASPTFDISKHSNFHKRIMKKRKAAMIR